jgi:hypothetical protein
MPGVVKAVIEAPFLHEMMAGLEMGDLDQDPSTSRALWNRMARRPSITVATGRRCRR